MYAKLIVSFIIFGLGTAWACPEISDAAPQGEVTLMGTLAEWMYPGSNFGGGQMSDGGNRRLQSVKCQAILTTGDSVEKVTKFYSERFVSGPQDAETKSKSADAQSVSTQDDSQGRPVQLRVIVVNRSDTSTTLVISRAEGETKTHIAWSHYVRFDGNR
jgi:hypothetical protein